MALAQAAARDAVGERGELEHMLTWLTGAHAEEAAMHRTFKAEVHWGNAVHSAAVQSVGAPQCCKGCAGAVVAAVAAVSLLD